MRKDLTITGGWTMWIARGLEALGLDLASLCVRAGLQPSMLRDPDARVPVDLLVGLWEEAERAAMDPLVGLHAGEHTTVSLNHVLSLIIACSRNLRDGLARASLYNSPLFANRARAKIADRGDNFSFEFDEFRGELPAPRHQVDFTVAALAQLFALCSGGSIGMRAVYLRHRYSAGQREYERVFGCPVLFGQSWNGMLIPRRVMLRPSPSYSPQLVRRIEAIAAEEARKLASPGLRAQLQDMIQLRLGVERTDSDSLAAALHMSSRTLQRRLHDEGTHYAEVIDAARCSLACELLSADESVARVAKRCGFANPTSFVRAFRRWKGETPGAFRAKTLKSAPADVRVTERAARAARDATG